MDALAQTFAAAQGWIFEQWVQPLFFRLNLMAFVDDAYDAVGVVMVGVIEIGALCALFKPLEKWRPVEHWSAQERKSVREDVIYTTLHRLGVLPLVIFLLLVMPMGEFDAWLRMNDMVHPTIEDLIPGIARNGLAAFIIYLLVFDLVEYGMHRLQHRWNGWWALHSLHHSQRQMSFWSDDRNHLLDDIVTSAVLALVALAIGVPTEQYVMLVIGTRMIESLSHVNARIDFGWLGNRLLVGPSFHRRHHAIGAGHEGAARGCNFATLFPVWDILFRTADFSPGYQPTGIRDQLEGRDYGAGFWRQQWMGLVRLKNAARGSA